MVQRMMKKLYMQVQFITNAFSEDKQLPWYLAPFFFVPSHFALWSGLNTSV